ncbi:MAG: diaminopimelate epimerase [Gammaproteobacteria bacterium]|nr:diaminopimelate epimerase [Gammaproteobacteria bacterium]
MDLHFTKMHGLGNDFVVINAISQPIEINSELARKLADRRFGIGCDQILVVEQSNQNEIDFKYRIFNADGGEVAQCGNGARCFAHFVREEGLTDKDEIVVETASGTITLYIEEGGDVRVNMGRPNFEPNSLPFLADQQTARYELEFDNQNISVGAVSVGNPHIVHRVETIEQASVAEWGPALERHPLFPERVNVGFMEILSRSQIRLRVFERGTGETLACGTGACAAVAIGINWGELDNKVEVLLPAGRLIIEWQQGDAPIWMTGPATTVFKGTIEI